jgi:hypothetical protein
MSAEFYFQRGRRPPESLLKFIGLLSSFLYRPAGINTAHKTVFKFKVTEFLELVQRPLF